MASIRELKQRYKINLALGRVLPTHDLGIPLPFSTGNPLYDAALTDKLVMTSTMNEPAHLNRAWQLVRQSSPAERQTLAQHARGVINDYKLLLALRSWELGEDELVHRFLWALPWHWRLAFPAAVLKPAAHFFIGWRKDLTFRLVENPRYPELRQLFKELLAKAPPVALLKYRQTVKAAAALQRYRFEGEREVAIHDLCFYRGEKALLEELEPIPTYVRARDKAQEKDINAMMQVLENSAHEIPITSYMGLLGNAGFSLNLGLDDVQNYAVRCATAVECLLRLQEWEGWLQPHHAQTIGRKVQEATANSNINLPLFKVIKGFINAPYRVRQLTLEPMLLPLLYQFGQQSAALLPTPGPLTYMQPGNVIHITSFLLYSVLSTAMPTRFFLLYKDGLEELPPLPLKDVAQHLASDGPQLEKWLLQEFGGLVTHHQYTYDFTAVGEALGQLDPEAPLLLDLPFTASMDVLHHLLPFERIFNLNTAYGAPGEVCLSYEYYSSFSLQIGRWYSGYWSRYSDQAAQKFSELLDRLHYFQLLAE